MAQETELNVGIAMPEAMTGAHRRLQLAHDELASDHELLKAEHAALQKEHEDLKVKFGLAKKAYQWKEGDSECAPVPHNGKCETCGWTAESKEPHAILA